jgi:secretion/DNA translocation related TadE-like protein
MSRWKHPLWPGRAGAAGAEHGAATLIALALSALVVIGAVTASDLGALAVARAQAQTAADLAALAAVTPADGSLAAARAAEVAAANGARMTRCWCEPMEAVVGVRRRVLLVPFGVPVDVRADARAVLPGPANGAALEAGRSSSAGRAAVGRPTDP